MPAARHTQIYLVRHGEVAVDLPARRAPLTAAGREQARRVAEFLALRRPSVLYTSPLPAARETAAIVAERLEFAAKARPDLRGDASLDAPELARTAARAVGELERIARLHRGERVVCVTHGDVILASALHFIGRPYAADGQIEAAFGSVWMLSIVGGHVRLRYVDRSEIAARTAQHAA